MNKLELSLFPSIYSRSNSEPKTFILLANIYNVCACVIGRVPRTGTKHSRSNQPSYQRPMSNNHHINGPTFEKFRKRKISEECISNKTRTKHCGNNELHAKPKWNKLLSWNAVYIATFLRFVVFTRTNLFCTLYSLTFWRKSLVKWKVRHFLKGAVSAKKYYFAWTVAF